MVALAERIEKTAKQLVPVDEGDLRDSITVVYLYKKLGAIIGPGIKGYRAEQRAGKAAAKGRTIKISKRNKEQFFQFMKGLWIEFGTKGNPRKNIPARRATPFMGPAFNLNRTAGISSVREAIKRALRKASEA